MAFGKRRAIFGCWGFLKNREIQGKCDAAIPRLQVELSGIYFKQTLELNNPCIKQQYHLKRHYE
jgi:hypothetical protein